MQQQPLKIIVTREGPDPQKFLKSQLAQIEKMKPHVEKLAYEASNIFKYYVNQGRHRKGVRKKNSLANAFKTYNVTYSSRRVVFGLGDLDFLNSQYPYWYDADVGGKIPKPTKGWFGRRQPPDVSMAGKGTQLFHEDPRGYTMTPKHPTRPLDYIKKSNDLIRQKWTQIWAGFRLK